MDKFPKCQVCNKCLTSKGPIPYLLPCLHSACENCVTSKARGVVSCSKCKREFNLKKTHLQKDVVRRREIFHLTVQHRPSELLCTHEDDGNQAVCWCQECEEFLCEYCQNLHDGFTATRKHRVQEVGNAVPDALDTEEYCSIHPKYVLEFWDKNCESLICVRCRLGNHSEHNVMDIIDAAEATRTEVKKKIEEIKSVDESHKSAIDTIKKHMRQTEETSAILADKIGLMTNSLKSELDHAAKEVKTDLGKQTKSIKSDLEAKCKESQKCHLQCRMTIDYGNLALAYSSKHELLQMKNSIREITQCCLDSVSPAIQKNPVIPELHPEKLEKLKSRISSFHHEDDEQDWKENSTPESKCEDNRLNEQREKYNKKITWRSTFTTGLFFLVLCAAVSIAIQAVRLNKNLESELTRASLKIEELQRLSHRLSRLAENAENKLQQNRAKLKNTEERHNRTLSRLGIPHDVTPYLLPGGKKFLLYCKQLQYDEDKVNVEVTHVNAGGYLINKPYGLPMLQTNDRFRHYHGTCSTASITHTGFPQYWEVKAKIFIHNQFTTEALVLQIGLCREEQRDIMHSIPPHKHTFHLDVYYSIENKRIEAAIRYDGHKAHAVNNVMSNTAGSQITLQFGILCDDVRNMIAIIDTAEPQLMAVLKKAFDAPLWPMFGVYNPHHAHVDMKLVVGEDIEMSEDKKKQILKAFLI